VPADSTAGSYWRGLFDEVQFVVGNLLGGHSTFSCRFTATALTQEIAPEPASCKKYLNHPTDFISNTPGIQLEPKAKLRAR
jgi:hypothetical protein